jgi:hypothetical protein
MDLFFLIAFGFTFFMGVAGLIWTLIDLRQEEECEEECEE